MANLAIQLLSLQQHEDDGDDRDDGRPRGAAPVTPAHRVAVLLVEDDRTIADLLVEGLTEHGFEVTWAANGRLAVDVASRSGIGPPPEIVLLDLGLPDLDGVDLCRELRRLLPGAVIVMLTARGAEMDVIVGLDAGADDYLVKPVRLAELVARVRAHVRRGGATPQDVTLIRSGDLTVDLARRRVLLGEDEVQLRSKEFDLLARLVRDPGIALERRTLMTDVWDEHWFGPTKTLDVHVAKVRRALTEAVARAGGDKLVPHIRTLRGHGYRLEHPSP